MGKLSSLVVSLGLSLILTKSAFGEGAAYSLYGPLAAAIPGITGGRLFEGTTPVGFMSVAVMGGAKRDKLAIPTSLCTITLFEVDQAKKVGYAVSATHCIKAFMGKLGTPRLDRDQAIVAQFGTSLLPGAPTFHVVAAYHQYPGPFDKKSLKLWSFYDGLEAFKPWVIKVASTDVAVLKLLAKDGVVFPKPARLVEWNPKDFSKESPAVALGYGIETIPTERGPVESKFIRNEISLTDHTTIGPGLERAKAVGGHIFQGDSGGFVGSYNQAKTDFALSGIPTLFDGTDPSGPRAIFRPLDKELIAWVQKSRDSLAAVSNHLSRPVFFSDPMYDLAEVPYVEGDKTLTFALPELLAFYKISKEAQTKPDIQTYDRPMSSGEALNGIGLGWKGEREGEPYNIMVALVAFNAGERDALAKTLAKEFPACLLKDQFRREILYKDKKAVALAPQMTAASKEGQVYITRTKVSQCFLENKKDVRILSLSNK